MPKQTVKGVIRGHARVGGIGRIGDVNSQLASDADKVQVYNPDRFERGLKRFEDGEFPRYLLNATLMALLPLRDKIPQLLHFEKAKELQQQYYAGLKEYLKDNKERIAKILYPPLIKQLYKSLEIAQ